MTHSSPILAAMLALTLAVTATAQTTTEAPAPDATAPETAPQDAAPVPGPDDLSLGREETPEDGIGSSYAAEVHGDWELRCLRTEDGADPCQLYQLLMDTDGNPIAEFSIVSLPAGQPAVAGATAIVPLETLLTQELSIQVDSGAAKKYPFAWCNPVGCISRIGFTSAEVEAMKRGNRATVTIVPAVAPDQKVAVNMSLRGFTAGLAAVTKANGN